MTKMTAASKCPRCRENPANHNPSLGVTPCDTCQEEDKKITLKRNPEFISLSKHSRIVNQRDRHAEDIEQPWNADANFTPNKKFVEMYPELAQDYFTNEQLEKL